MKKVLIDFLLDLNDKGLINNHDFDYEKVAHDFANKDENGNDFLADVSHRFFPSFATKEFPWEANSDDDFICKLDDYTFRVEQMDKGHWWWRVYFKDEPIPERTNEFSNSKYRAIGYCEGLYMGHSLLNGG